MVGLVFKPLLDTSERDVPVIFGNILTETEDREGGGSKGEKKQDLSMIQFTCSNTSIISWGQILLLVHLRITVCWYDAHLSKRLTPRHVSVTQLLIHWSPTHTHPHPTTSTSIVQMLPSVYKTLALSPLWFCFKTLTANHFLWPESSINSCYLPIEESTVRQQGNTFLAHLLQCRFCKAAELYINSLTGICFINLWDPIIGEKLVRLLAMGARQ